MIDDELENIKTEDAQNIAKDKERLKELIKELAIVHGKVILSSGAEADYYVDLRRVTLHHEGSRLVGQLMLDMIDQEGLTHIEASGGLTMGADPVGSAIMHAAADSDRDIDAFVVRKAQKSYGMSKQVEGPDVQDRNVVVVEDTSTTGGSVLTAVEALRQAGATVLAVAVIVDRETGSKERIEAEAQVPYLALFSKEDLELE